MTFHELINGGKPVLVDFHASWCGPCKVMGPILEDLKRRVGDKASVVKVDVDREPIAARAYQVQGVPTLILFKNGRMLWRRSGVVSADDLMTVLDPHLG